MAKASGENEASLRRLTEDRLGRAVPRFGAPLVLGMTLHTAFNLVDLFMISRLEEATAALAALGICDMVAAVATILSNGISTATVALVGRGLGARDGRAVRRATWQSLLLVGGLSVAFGLVGVFGSEVLVRDLMQTKGEAADLAVAYLQVIMGGCFSIFFLLQLTAILRALGHAEAAAALLVGGNVLNIVLNVLFIYGPGPAPDLLAWGPPVAEALGIPRLGVVGAAWATLIGRTIPVIAGAALLARRRGGPRFHPAYLRPMGAELRAIVRIAWPSSAQLVLRVVAVLVIIGLVNACFTTPEDPSALTAYSICLRLETMALFVGMGWGATASSFVAANLGARLVGRAKRAGWLSAAYNLALMAGLAAVYVGLAEPLVAFFDPTDAVVAIGAEYLRVVAASYTMLGVGLVLSQAISGAGQTLPVLALDGVVLVGLVLPAAVAATLGLGAPRVALWTVLAVGNVAGALVFVAYYARGAFLAGASRDGRGLRS